MSSGASVIPFNPSPGYRATAMGTSGQLPDPVGELRFRVELQNVKIGAFSECTGLSAEWEVMEYQEGGEHRFTHKFRNRLKYQNVVLKRGVTREDELLKWFNEQTSDRAMTPGRGTLTITLVGEDGKPVRIWAFAGAFPVKWQGPSLNAKSTNVATETLEIAHQGLLPQS